MANVPNATLDAGDSTPKLGRASLILATEAINELYSFLDPDTDVTKLAIARTTVITGDLSASGNLLISGTITGTLSGNAATATKWATPRSVSMTGDVAWTATGLDGSANVTAVGTLATVNASPGSIGSASNTLTATVNGKGLVTAMASTPIAISTAQVTSGTFADARLALTNITQYQGNLSIAETQIPNGTILARVGDNESITGTWTFGNPIVAAITGNSGGVALQGFTDMSAQHALAFQTYSITTGGLNTPAGLVAGCGFEMRRAANTSGSSVGTYQMYVSNGTDNDFYLRKVISNVSPPNEVWGAWAKILTDQDTVDASGNELGWKNIPPVTSGFLRGGCYCISAAASIPLSNPGDTYQVYNDTASSIPLTPVGGLTLRLNGTTATGARNLLPFGKATIWYRTGSIAGIDGAVT